MKFYFLSVLFLLSSCRFFIEERCENQHDIVVSYTLTPQKDTFNLYDTIHYSCIIENPILTEGQEFIDLSQDGLLTELFIQDVDTIGFYQPYENFIISEKVGGLSFLNLVGVSSYRLNHVIEDNHFRIEFDLIPLKVGFYYVQLLSLHQDNDILGPLNIESSCDEFIDEFHNVLNGYEQNNFDLLVHAKNENIKMIPFEEYRRKAGFCFYVVE